MFLASSRRQSRGSTRTVRPVPTERSCSPRASVSEEARVPDARWPSDLPGAVPRGSREPVSDDARPRVARARLAPLEGAPSLTPPLVPASSRRPHPRRPSSSFVFQHTGIRAVAVKPVPGLHRVPGDTRVVAECASRYDEREAAPLRGVRDARAVASVLKLYLDALPSPLLRASASHRPDANANGPSTGPATIAAIAETQRERGHEAARTALRAFVAKRLPVCNRDALRATCAHLRRVARAEAHAEAAKKRLTNVAAARAEAAKKKTLAAAFGKTLCGESLGSSEAGSVVELLLEHHDFVFGVSRTAPDRRATNDANDANDDARSGDKENVSSVAKVEGKSKSSAPEGEGASHRVDVDSCDVDSATLDVVRAFFDGDDGVCAEADRALGGSLCGWLFATSEDVERMSREALRREKTAIKRRLRAFDVSVERDSRGARSTKEDKKHLRPLYLRLARVKRRMQIEANAEGDKAGASSVS